MRGNPHTGLRAILSLGKAAAWVLVDDGDEVKGPAGSEGAARTTSAYVRCLRSMERSWNGASLTNGARKS